MIIINRNKELLTSHLDLPEPTALEAEEVFQEITDAAISAADTAEVDNWCWESNFHAWGQSPWVGTKIGNLVRYTQDSEKDAAWIIADAMSGVMDRAEL